MPVNYAGHCITVMGLGRFGGGVGVTQFLSSRGAMVTVTDTASADELATSVAQVRDLPGVSLVLGEHREKDFRGADLVVANPAVKPSNPFLRIAHDAGVPVTTEIVLLVRELPNRLRTIGVTGSAGKSTTTAMIGHVLRKVFGQETETPRRQGAKTPSEQTELGVWVGGNLGGSLLPVVDQIGAEDWVVLELSSFMLHYLREEKWSPHIAVVTNLSPNHLDWHGTFEAYAAAKRGVLAFQNEGDHFVFGEKSPGRWEVPRGRGGSVPGWTEASEDVVELYDFEWDLAIPGWHNRRNAAIACEVARYAVPELGDCPNGPLDGWRSTAEAMVVDFAGLPHRLAYVGALEGVPAEADRAIGCFNDSKSTTPEAAVLGMEAFEPGRVHVILGGYDKGSDLSEMGRVAAERCAGVYAIGATGGGIVAATRGCHPRALWVEDCGTLENAVAAIRRNVKGGEVVLLSPGCASWDQFANYEERGERFVALVRGGAASRDAHG